MGILWCLVKSNRRCKHGIKEHNSLWRDVTWKFSCCMYVDKLEFIYLLISVESILCSWDSKQVCRGPLWLRLDLQLICTFPPGKGSDQMNTGKQVCFCVSTLLQLCPHPQGKRQIKASLKPWKPFNFNHWQHQKKHFRYIDHNNCLQVLPENWAKMKKWWNRSEISDRVITLALWTVM